MSTKIAFLGDIALYGRYSISNGQKSIDYFNEVAGYLAGFDHVIGNLESPLCGSLKEAGQKSAYLRAPAENTQLLRRLNISIVNLANNHMFDYGRDGYIQTIAALAEAGIDYFGVDRKEVFIGKNIALHGYCSFNTNPLGVANKEGIGLNTLDVRQILNRMSYHHDHGRFNIISIHSGQEHINYPSLDDIRMARYFSEYFPYVYYGHHPHVMQGLERCNDSLIAYSLGNFCFDDVYSKYSSQPLVRQTRNNKTGLILEIEVEGNQLLSSDSRIIFAAEEKMELDPEGENARFLSYSKALTESQCEYEAMRQLLINDFLQSRRKNRDIRWIVKRLNVNSVGMLIRASLNKRQYRNHVSKILEKIAVPAGRYDQGS